MGRRARVLLLGVGVLLWVLLAGASPSPEGGSALFSGGKGSVVPVSAHLGGNQITTFHKGSLIIPMDTTYQDMGMLEAYGLLYHLLKSNIPVHWVIKLGKKLGDADFTASAKDVESGAAISSHGYRGGPFVVESAHAAKALVEIKAWQAKNTTVVHETTADFQARTGRLLTAAPTIAVIADSNEKIAFKYLNAAKIPDSTGKAWPTQDDKTRVYAGFPDVLDVKEVSGPTTTNHADGKLFRPSGLPAYCQIMTMHWSVKDVVDEVVAEYREFLKYPTHVFAHCQAVNAIENNKFGRFLTPKGFIIDNKLSDKLSFLNLDTPFAQMDGPFEVVGGSERAYSLPPGDSYLARNVVMITDSANPPGQRDVWMTGYLDGKCAINEDDLSCPSGVGKVSYLGGHAYDVDLPVSKNPKTQGARLFLNSLFEASCATSDGQPRVSLVKQGPVTTTKNTVTYTLFYNNFGAGPAHDVVLTDTLPAGATYVSSTGGGTAAGNVVTWKLGDLARAKGGSVQVTVTFGNYGVYTNKFTASYVSGVTKKSTVSNEVVTRFSPQGSEGSTADGNVADGGTSDGGPPEGNVDAGPPPEIRVKPGGSNCQPPNLLIVLDRSGSMKFEGNATCPNNDCLIVSDKTCTQESDCKVMARTHQPLPGTSAKYTTKCESGRCKYTRWDIAQNALKELAFQYGGSAGQNYLDRKIHFGLVSFNDRATLDTGIVADPPALRTGIDGLGAAGGTHYTSALLEAHKHLHATLRIDPVSGRPTHILFMTDGAPSEGCQSPVAVVRDLFQGTGPYRLQDDSGKIHKVKTYVIGFGSGLNASAKTCLSELAAAGGTQRCNPGVAGCLAYYFADNAAQLKKALDAIVDNATQEVCDGVDNDCDGQVDEGIQCTGCTDGAKRPCYTGAAGTQDRGLCKAGSQLCVGGKWDSKCEGEVKPAAETCDGKDNDCDGSVDEGLTRACQTKCGTGQELCRAGAWASCSAPSPTAEICDGVDNDCDGQIDEGGCSCNDGEARSCYTGAAGTKDRGECKGGRQLCVGGKWDPACRGEVKPAKEVCRNGKDEDCDGQADEDCPTTCKDGETRPCPTFCGPGKQVCSQGAWQPCKDVTEILIEKCDGKDNDCDGRIDEGLVRSCQTPCEEGLDRCVNGNWTGCQGRQPTTKESCDGVDDDCDGKVDNGAQCTGGAPCTEGVCPSACRNGECPAGQVCREGFCYPRVTCAQITCPKGQICRGGKCTDPCDSLSCPQGFVCWQGKCGSADCYALGCPQGRLCLQGVCVADPCASLRCADGEYCKAGRCVKTCTGVSCAAKERCEEGICKADPCAGVSCDPGKICYYGSCLDDPCKDVKCPTGRVCVEGGCVDEPCKAVRCPDGLTCQKGACVDLCKDKSCQAGQACKAAVCIPNTCYSFGCSERKICQEGKCVEDLCKDKRCAADAYCRGGSCIASCVGISCKTGERCRDGSCEPDPCASKVCPTGEVCQQGQCIQDRCQGVSCGEGRICVPSTGQCEDDPCLSIRCPSGGVCREGQCVSACAGINCPKGFVCSGGACVIEDCYHQGCPEGKVCRAGQCVDDPCLDNKCGGSGCGATFCRDGKCLTTCTCINCPRGESCRDGKCVADPCAGVTCPEKQSCIQGTCKPNPCLEVFCGPGRVCNPENGKCVDDPCTGIDCPPGLACAGGSCVSNSADGAPSDGPPSTGENKGDGSQPQSKDSGNAHDGSQSDKRVSRGGCTCGPNGEFPLPFLLLLFLLLSLRPRQQPNPTQP